MNLAHEITKLERSYRNLSGHIAHCERQITEALKTMSITDVEPIRLRIERMKRLRFDVDLNLSRLSRLANEANAKQSLTGFWCQICSLVPVERDGQACMACLSESASRKK
jgi:hypothetical protein